MTTPLGKTPHSAHPVFRAYLWPWQNNDSSAARSQPRHNRRRRIRTGPESESIRGKRWPKQWRFGIIISRWPRRFAASIPQARDQIVGKDTTRSLRWTPKPKRFSPQGQEGERLENPTGPENSKFGAGGPVVVPLAVRSRARA